jgi:hypothetical protein
MDAENPEPELALEEVVPGAERRAPGCRVTRRFKAWARPPFGENDRFNRSHQGGAGSRSRPEVRHAGGALGIGGAAAGSTAAYCCTVAQPALRVLLLGLGEGDDRAWTLMLRAGPVGGADGDDRHLLPLPPGDERSKLGRRRRSYDRRSRPRAPEDLVPGS